MQITALAGGVGGARFLRGLRAHLDASADPDLRAAEITVIGNTGDDITLFGLRVCPDLDTVMYTLGGGIDEAQGWGRADETPPVQGELAAYGVQPQWFGLGDRDFATHIARSQLLGSRLPAEPGDRGALRPLGPGRPRRIRLLPMSDDPVETHVVVDGEGRTRAAGDPLPGVVGPAARGRAGPADRRASASSRPGPAPVSWRRSATPT